MKLRRRIGSVFLAFAMALSLIPSVAVSALAADDNAEIITQAGTSSRYRVDGKDLAKMLVANDVSANAEVNAINIHFKSDYKIGANYGRVFGLYMENPVNTRDWVTSQDFLNRYADVRPDNIDYLEIQVKDGKTIQIKGEDLTWDCKQTSVATYRYHLKLKNAEISTVTFWYQPAANLHWTEYATVTVKTGSVLGDQMPDDPKWIAQHFAFWEIESSDGTGDAFTANTVVTEDMNVYARKVSAGGGSAYHVMDQAGLITYIKDHELIDAGASVVIENISIVGKNNEATNPDYFSNGWKDEQTYYYIYNADASADDITPQYQNTRVPVDEITNMILTYTVGDSTEQTITIPRNDFVPKPLAGGAGTDVIVEIWLNEEDAEGSQNVAWSINYYVDDALSQTETGAAAVGTQITASKTDSYAQYLEYPANQTKILTVGNSDNVLNLYYYTDANNDGIPDIYQIKVIYQIVGGTWDGISNTDQVAYVTKRNSEGNPAAEGIATLGTTIPDVSKAEPGAGFSAPGAWTDSITSETVVTQETTYTYSFTEIELSSYNVNYHIVGDIGTCDWTVPVQAGTEHTYTVPAALPGYTFDGWYEKQSDIGNENKKEPPTVTVNKKYEVYGKYVIDTEHPPEEPDEDAVIDLLGCCVQLECDRVTDHKCGYKLKADSFTIGTPTVSNNVWTLTVTVKADKYLEDYNNENVGTHKLADGETGTKDIVLTWDATANNNQGAWVRPTGKLLAIFDVTCKPDAPTIDELNDLDLKVTIDCIDNVGHEDETYDLLDNRVTGSSDVYILDPVAQDTGTCKLTIFADEYVKAYGEEKNIQARHKLADENVYQQTIELKWDGVKWSALTTKVTFNVTGDKEYDPSEPDDVSYTVNYFYDGEQDKDASYTGWGRERDVVSQYIDKSGDGYTLDKATGVPLTLAVDGENIINVYYATDKWNAEDDDPTTGDGIPDYKQVLIAYVADVGGTVAPATQVETLEANADGKYIGTVTVGSTATANTDYAFAFWMGPNDSTFWDEELNTTLAVEGGKTYQYVATFGTDLIGPEDPTGEDPDKPGDGIPDKYQVVVKYVAGKGGEITGKQVEVLTIYDAAGHYSSVGDVTATGSQAAAFHNWDFSRWVDPNGGVASWRPTLGQQTIEDAEGGNTYDFTALFRHDPYIPPVVDPDPDDPTPPVDPDKPQLNTEDHYAYIVGYEDGTVRPEGDITRAEVATIFFRLLTDESRDEFWSQTNPYSDVSEDDWYNNAVSTLTNAGIIDGYEDGTFKPNGNITRAEFATIAVRFFEATYEGENLFPDIDGHWAQDYINEAANAGIVDGYPDGTFGPQKLITRAEAMTMVNRTIDRHPHEDHLLADMIVWPDNPETAWYYEQVQEATNSHEYTMNTDDEQNPYEIWTELLPVRDWAQLEKEWSDAHSGQSGGDVV